MHAVARGEPGVLGEGGVDGMAAGADEAVQHAQTRDGALGWEADRRVP